jgi:hypothetical protein
VRKILRVFLIALLIVNIVDAPVWARSSRPLGVVVEAQRSRLGSTAAERGATVFAGDALATDAAGSLRLLAGGAQLYLLPESATTLSEIDAKLGLTLHRGAVLFSSSGRETVEVRALEAAIRSRADESAHGRVAIVSPNELEIASYRGTLDVTLGNETRTVTEGSAYRVILEPEPQGPRGAGAGAPRSGGVSARGMWIIVGAVAVATAIVIWRATISPDHP